MNCGVQQQRQYKSTADSEFKHSEFASLLLVLESCGRALWRLQLHFALKLPLAITAIIHSVS